jgi:hypothetical protein
VLKADQNNDHMDIIRYNNKQPDIISKEFVDKVGPHVSGSAFRADDQHYEQNRSYVQKSTLKNQKSPNPLGNQNSELTKNTHIAISPATTFNIPASQMACWIGSIQ